MQLARAIACALVLAGHAAGAKPAVHAAAALAKPAKVVKTAAKPATEKKATPVKQSKEKSGQNALAQMSAIMANAQATLASAEKHHERAVQKARSTVDALFQEQAKFMGLQVASYASKLDEAARELSAVINASKAELTAEEAAEAKNSSVGWGGEAMEERARVGAKADVALRELHHIMRKRDRTIEEATRHAMEPLDDAAEKLSRHVGDLSSVSDDAKATLDWAMRKGGVGGAIMAAANITKDAKAVQKVLEAARNITEQKIKMADKEFTAVLANATNSTSAQAAKIEKGLVDAEKEEIKRVRR